MKSWRSLLAVAALASAAWAQTDSGLFGTVKDQTGAGLPEALVTIRNVETGAVRKVATDQAGPGTRSIDLSAVKNTPISERLRLQFRTEIFNVLNHANFGTPNPVVFSSASAAPSATAGLITATSTASRQIQFGLKAIW
jgi:hypothetical protein